MDFVATPLAGHIPFYTCFTDLSTDSPVSWSWDFGDGSLSNVQDPCHIYETVGNYSVSLTTEKASLSKLSYITATPCQNPYFMLNWQQPIYQSTIQDAYNTIQSYGTLLLQAFTFKEDVVFYRDTDLQFLGGFMCDFLQNPTYTTINGSLTISGGRAEIDNVIIR
jgi:PKD repeat protein